MDVLMGNTIDNNGPSSRPSTYAGPSAARSQPTAGQAAETAAARQAPQHGGSHVRFSDSVALLQQVHSQIEAEPVVRTSEVAAARIAIDNGSYQIDHHQIATSLLTLDRELP